VGIAGVERRSKEPARRWPSLQTNLGGGRFRRHPTYPLSLLGGIRHRPATRLFDAAKRFVGIFASKDEQGCGQQRRPADPLATVDGNVLSSPQRRPQTANELSQSRPRSGHAVVGDRKGVIFESLLTRAHLLVLELELGDFVRSQQRGHDIEAGSSPRAHLIGEPVTAPRSGQDA